MLRLKIVIFHFLISLAITLIVLFFITTFWYPSFHSQDPNFRQIFLLVLCVDITLGPLITAIIFKPKKKGLKFDFTVIAILQVSALVYGLSTVYIARPAFIVFNIDRFNVVSFLDISEQDLKKAPSIYQNHSYTGPLVVGSRLPNSPKLRQEILMSSVSGGADIAQLPQYYLPYPTVMNEVKNKLQSLDNLIKRKPKYKKIITDALAELSIPVNEVGFLPVITKSMDVIALINRNNTEILEYLPINSW